MEYKLPKLTYKKYILTQLLDSVDDYYKDKDKEDKKFLYKKAIECLYINEIVNSRDDIDKYYQVDDNLFESNQKHLLDSSMKINKKIIEEVNKKIIEDIGEKIETLLNNKPTHDKDILEAMDFANDFLNDKNDECFSNDKINEDLVEFQYKEDEIK